MLCGSPRGAGRESSWVPLGSRMGQQAAAKRSDIEVRLKKHFAAQLTDAAMGRDRERVSELLQASADPNVADEQGRLPLHAAAFAGSAEAVASMLEAGADANLSESSSSGDRPLQIAAWQGHLQVARLLLRSSASTDAADGRGWTPLCSAAKQGHTAIVQVLLGQGADPERKASVHGLGNMTPLQVAKSGRHLEVAQALQAALATKRSVGASPLRPRPKGPSGVGGAQAPDGGARGRLRRLGNSCCGLCGAAG